jgi:hypothetical protein
MKFLCNNWDCYGTTQKHWCRIIRSAYENALVYDLREKGFEVQQLAMPFIYKEVKQDIGYRIEF